MADGLTKALQGPRFQEFIKQIGLVDIANRLIEQSTNKITTEHLNDLIQDEAEQCIVGRSPEHWKDETREEYG